MYCLNMLTAAILCGRFASAMEFKPPCWLFMLEIPDDLFDEDDDTTVGPAEPDMCAYEANDYTLEDLDEYLTASVMMLQG